MSMLSFDIGSSHCKGVLFSERGEIIAQRTSAYTPDFPRPSFAEVNPETFWTAVCTLSRRLVAQSSGDPINAISLSSHGETFIPVNHRGEPIGPAILNIDNRAVREANWLEERFGRAELFRITGQVAHAIYSIPKILWLQRNRPDVLKASDSFLSVPAYLLLRMGMPAYIDYSLASRFLAFDLRTRQWSPEILSSVDLTAEVLPLPVPAGTIAGKLSAAMAANVGVPTGTPVVLGGHDQACGALGSGVIEAGRASDSMGTYECILTTSNKPQLGDEALAAGLNSAFHVVPERFTTLAYFPAGIMLQWFHDLIYGDCKDSPDCRDEAEHFSELESSAPPSPSGLCITPHLIGTGNPDFNPRARGAILGLSTSSDRGHIYKGILEGLACELSQMSELLAMAVGDFRDIYASGGGTRSSMGLRLRAALTGRRIHLMRCPEAVCLGGAILAGVATGIYRDIPEAVAQMVREVAVIEPDAGIASAYASQVQDYRRFCTAWTRLRGPSAESIQPGEET
jgi:xylulokinase